VTDVTETQAPGHTGHAGHTHSIECDPCDRDREGDFVLTTKWKALPDGLGSQKGAQVRTLPENGVREVRKPLVTGGPPPTPIITKRGVGRPRKLPDDPKVQAKRQRDNEHKRAKRLAAKAVIASEGRTAA
jgi:hypothetical protein